MGVATQVELIQAYSDATVDLRTGLVDRLGGMFLDLGAWRSEDVPGFLDSAVPLVEGAIGAMVNLTDAYLGSLIGDMVGTVLGGGLARPSYPRPVTPGVVYRRPFATVWTALAGGQDLSVALDSGRARLENMAATDLQLAKRAASREVLESNPRVVGYRRVLTGSRSCALCILAATQRYHKRNLMPCHPGCNCTVAPLIGDEDPGQRINAAVAKDKDAVERGETTELDTDTDALHDAINARFGADKAADLGGNAFRGQSYRDLVVVHEHGELGPVLARKGDKFTGPDDIG